MSEEMIHLNEEVIKGQIKELVRGSVVLSRIMRKKIAASGGDDVSQQ